MSGSMARIMISLVVLSLCGIRVAHAEAPPAEVADHLPASVRALLAAQPAAEASPTDPNGALTQAIAVLADQWGHAGLNPGPTVAAASLPAEVAGRLALVVAALSACQHTSSRIVQHAGDLGRFVEDGSGKPDPAWAQQL